MNRTATAFPTAVDPVAPPECRLPVRRPSLLPAEHVVESVRDTEEPTNESGSRFALSESDRRWMWSLATSTVTHLAVIGILALVWFSATDSERPDAIESVLLQTSDNPVPPPLEVTALPSVVQKSETTLVSGGSSVSVIWAAEPARELLPQRQNLLSVAATPEWANADLAEQLDLVGAAIGRLNSGGSGDGTGEGQGNGEGDFFGIRPVGKRFVFVLDCSGSMNRPHDSEAKTRFKRLKLELVRSIGRMSREQEFYIIFFNAFAIPMPTSVPAAASQNLKEKYLYWMAGIQADGETEPTRALQLALRMKPDVVYFLTDGTFSYRVEQELLSLPKGRSRIHTFAFHEPFNEAMATAYKLIDDEERALARKAASKGEFRKAFAIWKSHQFLQQLAERHNGGDFYLIP